MRFPLCIAFLDELTLLATNRVSSRIWLKSGLVGSALNSLSKSRGYGFESHSILDRYGVKAIPGSIPVPNP